MKNLGAQDNIIFSLLETFAFRIARISAKEKNKSFTPDLRNNGTKALTLLSL
jgi:hypothetical protein